MDKHTDLAAKVFVPRLFYLAAPAPVGPGGAEPGPGVKAASLAAIAAAAFLLFCTRAWKASCGPVPSGRGGGTSRGAKGLYVLCFRSFLEVKAGPRRLGRGRLVLTQPVAGGTQMPRRLARRRYRTGLRDARMHHRRIKQLGPHDRRKLRRPIRCVTAGPRAGVWQTRRSECWHPGGGR